MTYNASSVATFGDGWAVPLIIETTDTVLGNVSTDVTTAALSDSNKVFWILANNQEYLKNLRSTGNQTFTLSAAATSGLNTIQTYVNTWPKEINHTYTIAIQDGATGFQTSTLTCAGFYGNGTIILSDNREATSIATGATATTEGFRSITFSDCSISNIVLDHTAGTTAQLTFFATSVGTLLTFDNVKSKVNVASSYFYNGDTVSITARCLAVTNSQDITIDACEVGLGGYIGIEIYDNSFVTVNGFSYLGTAAATDKDLYIRNASTVVNVSTAGGSAQVFSTIVDFAGTYHYFTTSTHTWEVVYT